MTFVLRTQLARPLPWNSLLSVQSLPLSVVNARVLSPAVLRRKDEFQGQNPIQRRGKKDDVSSLFIPVPLKVINNPDDINVGAELTGMLKKDDLLRMLNKFFKRQQVKIIAKENGLDGNLFHEACVSFRHFCLETESLPVDLHIIFSDILQEVGHVDDIFPYFLKHAKQIFPHLECMDDLKKISDLTCPPKWYPMARAITRKIIFHMGPTNSGKTYHALERFLNAKSGIYCGPLKLLASEVFHKANAKGTPCDLVTGEERIQVSKDDTPSSHVSCTVEMASINAHYEVAVIDEIQMIKDMQRGWAWTRAVLGVVADEIHLCGEAAAVGLVQEIMLTTGEELEVRKYKRLTELHVEDKALKSLADIRPGDCFVCFSKQDIYQLSRQIEQRGHECAVIYGGLPPGTKLTQAQKFNDPDNPCKIMVATDAIGMGLNLSIRRIIFYSLIKPVINNKGEKEMDYISTSQALQISGRAGRYGTEFPEGYVTTFKEGDLPVLQKLLAQLPEDITHAGLQPTADQIELYAYHLPNATLSNLIDIFVTLSTVDDSLYFICNVDDFKFLADMVQHVPLPLRARYIFCCAPINKKLPYVCTMFLKFARQYSKNEALTLHWVCRHIGWPFKPPHTIMDQVHLEQVFDVLDLYLWLSYRFPDLFPDARLVRDMQRELDNIIEMGVSNIIRLLENAETRISSGVGSADDEDSFVMRRKKETYRRDSSLAIGEEKQQSTRELPNARKSKKESPKVLLGKKGVRKGKLTEQLLNQGLLTPKMLEDLQKEWKNQFSDDEGKDDKGKR